MLQVYYQGLENSIDYKTKYWLCDVQNVQKHALKPLASMKMMQWPFQISTIFFTGFKVMMTFTGFTVGIYNVGPDFSMVLYSQHASVYIATSFFQATPGLLFQYRKSKKRIFQGLPSNGTKMGSRKVYFQRKIVFLKQF